jgi:predicted O-methyltransferase YrrM
LPPSLTHPCGLRLPIPNTVQHHYDVKQDFPELYEKYADELAPLCLAMRDQYLAMQRKGFRAGFGDGEGELLYLAVRELKPDIVFEISPAAGYSTNYLLAALTRNGSGQLHSFELDTKINGIPTRDVITGNLLPELDLSRFNLYIGDAVEESPKVEGDIGFCLIDSCHEEWFAKWYTEKVIPRVKGLAVIQDIVFHDRLEKGDEPTHVWKWLHNQKLEFELIGQIERSADAKGLREGLAERRNLESNSVVFQWPQSEPGTAPTLNTSPDELLRKAEASCQAGKPEEAEQDLTRVSSLLLHNPMRGNRHRLWFRMGACYSDMGRADLAERCFQRSIGTAVFGDGAQRAKGLRDISRLFRKRGAWRLAFTTMIYKWIDRVFNAPSWRIPK